MNAPIQGHQATGGATKRAPIDPSVPVPPGVKAQADRANALIEQAKEAKAANEAAGGNELVRPLVPPPRSPNPNIVTGNYDPRNPNPPEFGDPGDTRVQSQPATPLHPHPRQRRRNRKTRRTGSISSNRLKVDMIARPKISGGCNRR